MTPCIGPGKDDLLFRVPDRAPGEWAPGEILVGLGRGPWTLARVPRYMVHVLDAMDTDKGIGVIPYRPIG